MDEKTQELREIFMDVADAGSVTERQEESPGTLAKRNSVEKRIIKVIDRMRERYAFSSDFDDEGLIMIARGFYDDLSDDEIAESLDVGTEEVFEARLDLHLLKDEDRDAPFDFEDFRRAVADPKTDLGETFSVDEALLEHFSTVVAVEQEMRRANYRFRDEFDDILGDGDIAAHLTRDVTDDGLADATEGLEINTAF